MIRDHSIANLVLMNVLHLKVLTGGLHADQESAIDGPSGDASVGAADAATNDD
jgi:hypothetical protein